MARTYILDTKAAIESNNHSNFITTTGKYIGMIKTCYYDKNQNGTESVNILFESRDGKEAPLLTIYTHNGSGEQLMGYNLFNALMTCCKVKQTTWATEIVEVYNFSTKQNEKQQKEVCVELKNKPVGLVLRQEEYQNSAGETKTKITLHAPFEADTELMANEILERVTQPTALANTMGWIAKEPIKKLKANNQQGSYQASQQFQQPSNTNDLEDDIPF